MSWRAGGRGHWMRDDFDDIDALYRHSKRYQKLTEITKI